MSAANTRSGLRREVSRLAAALGHLGQRVVDVKSPTIITCAPKAREIASRSALIPSGAC
jgi:hypothetical protein